MLFLNTTNQPTPLREISYTVALDGMEPITVQKGGVQGEHRATRLKFNLDETFKTWCKSLLEKSRLFCRADACDGSGVVHRSLTLEMTAEMIDNGCLYYDLDQSVTRQGGFIKICLVFSLLNNENATWATVKSYYTTVELDASPTYVEEDYHDMTDMFEQTKVYAEQAKISEENVKESERRVLTSQEVVVSSRKTVEEITSGYQSAVVQCSNQAMLAMTAAMRAEGSELETQKNKDNSEQSAADAAVSEQKAAESAALAGEHKAAALLAKEVLETAASVAKENADSAKVNAEKAETAAEKAEEDSKDACQAATEAAASAENAEKSLKDIKNAFETEVIELVDESLIINLENNKEYRCTNGTTSIVLNFPSELLTTDKFSALLSFYTFPGVDTQLTYSTALVDFTNDDCENGVFIPLRNKRYDVALYWNGLKYQGIVRGVAL